MIHPFLAIPIAFWLAEDWNPIRRIAAFSLLAVGIGVQLFGSSQDFIEYYRIFYRNPSVTSRVLYDGYDRQYWEQFYRMEMKHPEREEWVRVHLGYAPAPTQHSIYIPQTSMWSEYPRMWGELGLIDNLWIRMIRENNPPSP